MSGTVLGGGDPHILQYAQSFSYGIAADPQLLRKFPLSGQSVARFEISVEYLSSHMVDHKLIRLLFYIFLAVLHR